MSGNYFYKIHLHFECKESDHFVFYRSVMEYSLNNVPVHAVQDGDLLDVFIHNVDYVLKITSEEYFEHMYC